jgi:SAM-dependent methyltransferase
MPDLAAGSPERFGYSWQAFTELSPEQREQFRRWTVLIPPEAWKGRAVLDAGCGGGRNTYFALEAGAASAVAIDIGEPSLAVARQRFANEPRAEVQHLSVYDVPWRDRFDIAFSIGVVHHLENPTLAVQRLCQAVRPGGTVLVWLYGHENNGMIVHLFDPLRRWLFSRLPLPVVHALSHLPTSALWLYLRLGGGSLAYHGLIRRFPYRHLRHIVFDQMIPRTTRYYRKDEARALLESAGLQSVEVAWVNEMSWCAAGTKPAAAAG